MAESKNDTFYVLYEYWKKSLKFFSDYFLQMVGIFLVVLLIYAVTSLLNILSFASGMGMSSALISYMYEFSFLSMGMGLGTSIIISILAFTLVQIFIYSSIFYLFEKGANKMFFLKETYDFIKVKAPQLAVLILIKAAIIKLGLILFIIPGVLAVIFLSFAEYYVMYENKNFYDAIMLSSKLALAIFWPLIGFYSIFYLLPYFLLPGPLFRSILMILFVANTLLVYKSKSIILPKANLKVI